MSNTQAEPSVLDGIRAITLQRMKYHHRPAEPEIGMLHDDFDLYDIDTDECKDCVTVVIADESELLALIQSKDDEIARLRAGLGNYVKCIASGGGGDMDLFMAAIREVDNEARAALSHPTKE